MYEIRMAHATIHAHAYAACDLIPVVGGEGEETLPGRRCLSFFIIFFGGIARTYHNARKTIQANRYDGMRRTYQQTKRHCGEREFKLNHKKRNGEDAR